MMQCLQKALPKTVTTGRKHRLNQGLFAISAGLQVHPNFRSTNSARTLGRRSPSDSRDFESNKKPRHLDGVNACREFDCDTYVPCFPLSGLV